MIDIIQPLDVIRHFGEHSIRITGTPDAPLFVASDVCGVLGLINVGQATSSLDEDDLTSLKMMSGGQMRSVQVLTESGLYSLIFKSRKDEAKAFRKWVTSEVLPSIRKTGSYNVKQSFQIPQTYAEALRLSADLAEKVQEQSQALAIAAPKVAFHDAVTESSDVCQLAVAAQVAKLPFGRNTLFQKLRQMGVLITGGDRHNLPKQEYIRRGYFTVNERKFEKPDTGEPVISFTTYATQKGIAWIVEQFAPQEAAP